MKVTIFGSTGKTVGSFVARQALELGHTVTVLVRDPQRFTIPSHENLQVIQGDVLNKDDVKKVISSETNEVIISLGSTAGSKVMDGLS